MKITTKNLVDGKYSFKDLVDINQLRNLFELFSKSTGFTTGLVSYPEQELLIGTGWRDICVKFHRVFPESEIHCKSSNFALTSQLKEGKELNIHHCELGLVDGATPIIIKGVHVANLFTGQILFEKPNFEKFKKQAQDYGYNTDDYITALKKVPVVTEERFKETLSFLAEIAVMLAEQGLMNIQIKEANKTIQISEAHLRTLFQTIPDLVWLKNLEGVYLKCNPKFEKFFGAKENDIVGKTDYDFVNKKISNSFRAHDKAAIIANKTTITEEEIKFADDGHTEIIETSKTPMYNNEGELIGVLGVARNITERKKMEDVIKNSELRLRILINSTPDIICFKDAKGRWLIANEADLELFSLNGVDYLGKTDAELAQFTDPIYKNAFLSCMVSDEEAWAKKKLSQGEEVIPTIDGSERVYDIIKVPVFDDSGKRQGLVVIGHDITERKKTEKELQKRSQAIEQSPVSIVITDIKGNIEYVNPKFIETTGYTFKETINQNPKILKSGEQSHEFYKNLWNTISSGKNWNGEFHNKKKNGELFWESAIISPIKDNNGKITHFVAVKEDITERKKVAEAIIESESKYRVLAENSVDFIWKVDMELNMLYASQSVYSILGYSQEEALKMNAFDFFTHTEYLKILELIKQELALGLKHKGIRFESIAVHKNGNTFPVEVTGKAIFNKEEVPIAISGYTKDISERKTAEKELLISKEKAENANKMKSNFLAQMSHEIRTPINALVSMASLLRYDFEAQANGDQIMSFEIIDRAGARIIRTIDLLLNLSEIQTGTYEKNSVKFDLYSEVLSLVVADNRKLAEKRNLKLILNTFTLNTELIADAYTVNQIFVQLIDNAIKYTNEGEIVVEVSRNENDQLVVEIKDTGIGIEERYLPNLFEPFSQEEMGYTRKYEGNGIGMALVKKYCELNNAKIEVESVKNVGTTFRIVF
ncbi:MAG: PAS domain S-box protein [Bacteroidetes bacterium]|nr:PAS domain S-box protein [Bacteroidota bacterium]MBU1116969.1 PAS domain S-box protein [Bacteroidota bacterium]MBU1799036.1 PAS domain S-box protein [Bacteroidota bacterium]